MAKRRFINRVALSFRNRPPWLFLYEIQPLYFLGMSVFYIVFILVSIGALVIMHKKIEAHFRKKL